MGIETRSVQEAGNYIQELGAHEVTVVNVDKNDIKNKPGEKKFEFTLSNKDGATIVYRCNDDEVGHKFLKQFGNYAGLDIDNNVWDSWDHIAQSTIGKGIGIVVKAGTPYPDPVTGDMKEGFPTVGSLFKINKDNG